MNEFVSDVDILNRIESELGRMSKAQKNIAQYILNNYDKASL